MTITDGQQSTLDELAAFAARTANLQAELARVNGRRDELIVEAFQQGISGTIIGRTAGMSHVAAYKIRNNQQRKSA